MAPVPPAPQVLQAQLEALRQGQENIVSSCTFTEQALHHGTATEVLLVKKQMSERLSELASREFPEHPHENAQLDCVVETDGVRKSVLNLGALVTTSAVAHRTAATGEGLRHAVVGQPASLAITTKDKDGELVRSGSASLRFTVTGPDGSTAESEVLDNKNGTYELLYTPRQEGDFLLSILLYGQPIRGSPFRARAVKASDVPPSPDDVKRRVKSPSSGHIRQKAVRRPSSMYSSGKKKENPIEDELIFRVGEFGCGALGPSRYQPPCQSGVSLLPHQAVAGSSVCCAVQQPVAGSTPTWLGWGRDGLYPAAWPHPPVQHPPWACNACLGSPISATGPEGHSFRCVRSPAASPCVPGAGVSLWGCPELPGRCAPEAECWCPSCSHSLVHGSIGPCRWHGERTWGCWGTRHAGVGGWEEPWAGDTCSWESAGCLDAADQGCAGCTGHGGGCRGQCWLPEEGGCRAWGLMPAVCTAGSRGREKGEFTNLQGISTSSSGRIVVADSNNQCVQVGASAPSLPPSRPIPPPLTARSCPAPGVL